MLAFFSHLASLRNVEWIHKSLHVPSFLKRYNQVLLGRHQPQKAHHFDFIALLFAIFAVSALFLSHTEDNLAAIKTRNDSVLYFELCQQALAQSDYVRDCSLTALQCINIMGLYFHSAFIVIDALFLPLNSPGDLRSKEFQCLLASGSRLCEIIRAKITSAGTHFSQIEEQVCFQYSRAS